MNKQELILQAIKDLNWDISNTYEYDDSCKYYTHIFLWEDGDYCLGMSSDVMDFQDAYVCTYICTVNEFYNYGVTIDKGILTKPEKAYTYYGDL